MRIGIDGGPLSITDVRLKVGVYRVAYEFVKEMQSLNTKNTYRIYSFGRGGDVRQELSAPNTQFVALPQSGFQKIWQPVELVRHPVDLYLGLGQTLPSVPRILCDVIRIGFIYDVGFLQYPEYYPGTANALKSNTVALVKHADHIVTISEASRTAILNAYHVDPGTVTVAHLGVSSGFTPKGSRYTHKHPYFLSVGSLKPGKNIPFMLRSFADFLKKTSQTYDYIIAGSDYWMDPEITETIEKLSLTHRVSIIGFVPDEELAAYYRGAVGLLSVSHIEGFGLPVAEAMSCGCPVIVSTGVSFDEVVSNCGMVVDPKDRKGLTDAMNQLATDSAYRLPLVKNGPKQAAKFTWRTFARTILTTCAAVYDAHHTKQ